MIPFCRHILDSFDASIELTLCAIILGESNQFKYDSRFSCSSYLHYFFKKIRLKIKYSDVPYLGYRFISNIVYSIFSHKHWYG